jgi:D-lactate dehydrogenase (quinone)
LDEHFNRESHSTLGSTFLNPTVAAGVAFGSGGTMCRKGPAYTERALYVKVDEDKWGRQIVRVVNTLDVDGLEDREEKLGRNYRPVMDSVPYRLDTFGKYIKAGDKDMYYTTDNCQRAASDTGYAERLCQKQEEDASSSKNVVNRSNADTHGPECCRCEGKVIVLATVHDTFPKPKSTKTFWLSFDSLELAQQFREQVALDNKNDVPIALEYLNQDAYEVIDQSGRFLAHCIHRIGMTSPLLRYLWHAKLYLEATMQKPGVVDQAWHDVNDYLPSVLPQPIQQMAIVYEHHAMLTIGEFGNGEMDRFLARMEQFVADANSNNNPNASDDSSSPLSSSTDINQGFSSSKTWKPVDQKGRNRIKVYECQAPDEASRLSAVRFVAAPAFRTWCVAHGVSGFSVDYALPGRGRSIPTMTVDPLKRMRYSHFACNVVHEDIAYPIDHDVDAIKHALKKTVELECGGRLPAEHGHGTEYVAPPEAQERWKKMDPLNVLNPGIGGLARGFRYREE